MTATNEDSGSDCDHWPDDASDLKQVAVAAPGYDSHNGLRSHTYLPPAQAPSSPRIVPAPQLINYQQPPAFAYPNVQYTYAAQPVPYPAPTYYAYAGPSAPVPQQQMANYHVYQPAHAAAPQQGNVWVGRTKAQVEEDNMKLAAKEGAYDKRKVVPTGVKDDQMMWCVETDGSHTLRTFISIKELKGEWKKDPRFEDSYYFVREAEEKKKD